MLVYRALPHFLLHDVMLCVYHCYIIDLWVIQLKDPQVKFWMFKSWEIVKHKLSLKMCKLVSWKGSRQSYGLKKSTWYLYTQQRSILSSHPSFLMSFTWKEYGYVIAQSHFYLLQYIICLFVWLTECLILGLTVILGDSSDLFLLWIDSFTHWLNISLWLLYPRNQGDHQNLLSFFYHLFYY